MDLFERINRAFGSWYEGLFGPGDDVRPRDILRLLLTALEENRKEGIDGRTYVPNRYILEISVSDPEEKEYLYAFLDRDELEAAVRQYCKQNNYYVRGVLDFTLVEKEVVAGQRQPPKIRVRCRYDANAAGPRMTPPTLSSATAAVSDDPATVAGSVSENDLHTVMAAPKAILEVSTDGGPVREERIAAGVLTIGRSSKAGNDLVIANDGLLSRKHARIELERDGQFTLYDLNTTNGTRVNGDRIENRSLRDGDVILMGQTTIRFRSLGDLQSSQAVVSATGVQKPPCVVVLRSGAQPERFVLAAETCIGRSSTNHVVLDDRSVAGRHARITLSGGAQIENLASAETCLVNGAATPPGECRPLRDRDSIQLGDVELRFEEAPST